MSAETTTSTRPPGLENAPERHADADSSRERDPGWNADVTPERSRGARAFRRLGSALLSRDFRVLWLGAFASTSGTWMQKVAQSWLVLQLTGSAFYLGLDAFLGELPFLLFSLLGGVAADRHDRRRLLLASQWVQMGAAFALAALVFWDVVQVWHVLVLSFVTGCAQAFGGPAYQSLIPSLVPREGLPNAIALNSIQFNLARVVGPLLAGVALAAWGTAACFSLNGLSFLVVIAALMSLHVAHVPPRERRSIATELRGGLDYVRADPALRTLTVLAFGTTFLGLPLLTLLPAVTRSVFGGDVGRYSELMAFSGMGAVSGALVVAWLGRFRQMARAAFTVQIAFGVLLALFALSRNLWASRLLLMIASAALIMGFALLMSIVQLVAPNHLRGRVMSIYMLAFRGGMPLGSLVAGYLATVWSPSAVLTVNGVAMAALGAATLRRRRMVEEEKEHVAGL